MLDAYDGLGQLIRFDRASNTCTDDDGTDQIPGRKSRMTASKPDMSWWDDSDTDQEIPAGDLKCTQPGCGTRFVPVRASDRKCPEHKGGNTRKTAVTICRRCGTSYIPVRARRYLPGLCESCSRPPYLRYGMGGIHFLRSYAELVDFERDRSYHFVAVDGEGTGSGDQHKYQFLGLGTNEPLIDETGIKIGDALRYLYDRYDKHAIYVSFYFGYDLSQLLSQVPWDRARMVFTHDGVMSRRRTVKNAAPYPAEFTDHRGQCWQFDVLEGKPRRIKFKPRDCKCTITKNGRTFPDTECVHQRKRNWFYICDVAEFFNTSFLDIVESDNVVATPTEQQILREGKAARGTAALDEQMILYNRTENIVLARVMDRVRNALAAAGIYLDKDEWIGMGKAAQKWMDTQPGILTRDEFTRLSSMTPEVVKIAQASYSGGINENIAHGIVEGNSWAYDRNSAYCADMADLPCLYHAHFDLVSGKPRTLAPGQLAIEHVTVAAPDNPAAPTGPLQYRVKGSGLIQRPLRMSGWCWSDEIGAAGSAGLIRLRRTDETLVITPGCDHRPFAKITDLYRWRKLCRKGSIEERVFKMLPSAVYGKLAQSAGESKYGHALYASLITSRNRTAVLNAMTGIADDVLMIIGDAIYTRHRHAELVSDRLGGFKETSYVNLTIVQPQLYYHDGARVDIRHGVNPVMKARGIRTPDDRAEIIRQCDTGFGQWTPVSRGYKWPEIRLVSDFDVTTPQQAAKAGNWSKCGQVRDDVPHTLTTTPEPKRSTAMGAFRYSDDLKAYVSSPPLTGDTGMESEPYSKEFGYLPTNLDIENLGNTPDGPRAISVKEMMK